jgi:merozoite surface protein 4
MTQRYSKRFRGLAVAGALGLAAVPAAQARHGADDPAGHDAGDDHGGLIVGVAQHGADDPANHDARDDRRVRNARVRHRHHRRHHGRHAQRRADDGPRHDAGDDHGTR